MNVRKTASERREMFKAKGANWREQVRAQKMRRLQNMRAMRIDSARRSVIRDIQLEEDLQLEQCLLEEQGNDYNQLHEQHLSLAQSVCPLCDRELPTMKNSQPCVVECENCGYTTSLVWEDFKQGVRAALEEHAERGCQRQPEFVGLEGELLIACDVCGLFECF